MTYRLTKFAGLAILPTGMPETPVGTGPTAASVVELPDGKFFDGAEDARADVRLPYDLAYGGKLLDDEGEGGFTFGEKLAELRKLRGTREQLERTLADGTRQWCYARLMLVDALRTTRNIAHQQVTLTFQVLSLWHGTYHDDTYTLSSSPLSIYIATTGDAEPVDVILTLTAASTPITEIQIERGSGGLHLAPEWGFQRTGVVGAGQVLVIDCGAKTVRLDGADAYSGFELLATHEMDEWLRLPADGWVYMTVTKTGGSAGDTLRLQWYDVSE